MTEIAKRISTLISYTGCSITDFEKKVGFKPRYVSTSLVKVKKIKNDIVEKILAAFPEFSREWIVTGEGKMLNRDNDDYTMARIIIPQDVWEEMKRKDQIIENLSKIEELKDKITFLKERNDYLATLLSHREKEIKSLENKIQELKSYLGDNI